MAVNGEGSSSLPFKTSDNYWWQYMYTITNSDAILFMTSAFMPIPERVDAAEAGSNVEYSEI